jgi:hypothetical protein
MEKTEYAKIFETPNLIVFPDMGDVEEENEFIAELNRYNQEDDNEIIIMDNEGNAVGGMSEDSLWLS